MAMPNNLFIVRHGRSEGNTANERSRKGDDSAFTAAFSSTSSAQWRLTPYGVEQAQAAGHWLRENFTEPFHRLYASEYVRAYETAMNLELPEGNTCKWFLEPLLRERDYGHLDVLTDAERRARFARELELQERDPLIWAPPGGESIAQILERMIDFFGTLHRECSGQNVVVVAHGEVSWAMRLRLERMPHHTYNELHRSEHPFDHMHNGQILQYSRVNPHTKEVGPYLSWKRSVCPWDTTLSTNVWEEIIRPRYSNEDLQKMVERYPRHLD